MRKWVETWKRAAPELEKIRHEEIRNSDTKKGIRAFNGLIFIALKQHPPEPTSGLIEQQSLFMKLRHAGTR